MPTPHGSRGGMAFSADELRVLRRALAQVLHPPNQALTLASEHAQGRSSGHATSRPPNRLLGRTAEPAAPSCATTPHPASAAALTPVRAPGRAVWAEDVQDVLRLAQAIDEAVDEAGRMRAFGFADLARYREALPGSAAGYLERLQDAVADGYQPDVEDLSALRALTALPCAPAERIRRLELRSRCGELAEAAVRRRLTGPGGSAQAVPAARPSRSLPALALPPAPAPALDNVAEFARPTRPQRPREQSRTRPQPLRSGGPIPMSAFDTAFEAAASAASAESGRHESGRHGSGQEQAGASARAIPTPGDLWPRGVRPDAGDEGELATATG